MADLILIRGNSGSGKTVLAEAVYKILSQNNNCLILHQDVIRRDILHTHDHINNPSVQMIGKILNINSKVYDVIILEGILRRNVYGDMLNISFPNFDHVLSYYLNPSFEETIINNQKKKRPFSIDQLKRWWRDDDLISHNDYKINNQPLTFSVSRIINDIHNF